MQAGKVVDNSIVCRSRKGAWIEMHVESVCYYDLPVAPARERGLKSTDVRKLSALTGRSRKGAWIEILKKQTGKNACMSLPQGSVD